MAMEVALLLTVGLLAVWMRVAWRRQNALQDMVKEVAKARKERPVACGEKTSSLPATGMVWIESKQQLVPGLTPGITVAQTVTLWGNVYTLGRVSDEFYLRSRFKVPAVYLLVREIMETVEKPGKTQKAEHVYAGRAEAACLAPLCAYFQVFAPLFHACLEQQFFSFAFCFVALGNERAGNAARHTNGTACQSA